MVEDPDHRLHMANRVTWSEHEDDETLTVQDMRKWLQRKCTAMDWPELFREDTQTVVISPLLWSFHMINSVSNMLTMFPTHLPIIIQPMSRSQIQQMQGIDREFGKTFDLLLSTFPYVSHEREDNEKFLSTSSISAQATKNRFHHAALNRNNDYDPNLLINGLIDSRHSPHQSYAERTSARTVFRVPVSEQYKLNAQKCNRFPTRTYFWRFSFYLVLLSRKLRYRELRNYIYNFVLNRDNEYDKQAIVVDMLFRDNKENTNLGKISILLRWFDILKHPLQLPHPPTFFGFFEKAFKCAIICIVLQHNMWKPYFFYLFAQTQKGDVSTIRKYFRVIGEINANQLAVNLTSTSIQVPTTQNTPYLKKKKRQEKQKKKKRQKGATAVPLALWLKMLLALSKSKDWHKRSVSFFARLIMLTCSRFTEITSFRPQRLQVETRQLDTNKYTKVLPIRIIVSKTDEQRYDIPIQQRYPFLNLENIINQLPKYLKEGALTCADTKYLGKITSANFTQLMRKHWEAFLRRPDTFFDQGETELSAHSLRKISAHLYKDLFGYEFDQIRLLFGHVHTSRTLENIYYSKGPNQIQQEMLWNN